MATYNRSKNVTLVPNQSDSTYSSSILVTDRGKLVFKGNNILQVPGATGDDKASVVRNIVPNFNLGRLPIGFQEEGIIQRNKDSVSAYLSLFPQIIKGDQYDLTKNSENKLELSEISTLSIGKKSEFDPAKFRRFSTQVRLIHRPHDTLDQRRYGIRYEVLIDTNIPIEYFTKFDPERIGLVGNIFNDDLIKLSTPAVFKNMTTSAVTNLDPSVILTETGNSKLVPYKLTFSFTSWVDESRFIRSGHKLDFGIDFKKIDAELLKAYQEAESKKLENSTLAEYTLDQAITKGQELIMANLTDDSYVIKSEYQSHSAVVYVRISDDIINTCQIQCIYELEGIRLGDVIDVNLDNPYQATSTVSESGNIRANISPHAVDSAAAVTSDENTYYPFTITLASSEFDLFWISEVIVDSITITDKLN